MIQDPNPPLNNDDELENETPPRTDVQRFESLIQDSRELPDLLEIGKQNFPPSFEELPKISHRIPATLDVKLDRKAMEDAIANTAELIDGILAAKPETWADKTAALEKAILVAKNPTHMISLGVAVDDPDEFTAVMGLFHSMQEELSQDHPQVFVSSTLLEEEVEATGHTMDRVRDGLRAAGLTGDLLEDCVNQMQNQGVLFRERT